MFSVGDIVCINYNQYNTVDTDRGVIEKVIDAPTYIDPERQLLKVYWERAGSTDAGYWPSRFILKV